MKNDLTPHEKNLLKVINLTNNTAYNYTHLMEWGTNKILLEKNLRAGEKIFEALGCFVAIKVS